MSGEYPLPRAEKQDIIDAWMDGFTDRDAVWAEFADQNPELAQELLHMAWEHTAGDIEAMASEIETSLVTYRALLKAAQRNSASNLPEKQEVSYTERKSLGIKLRELFTHKQGIDGSERPPTAA